MSVTTSTNYKFLVNTFKESVRVGVEEEKRIVGCGLEGASRTGKDWDKCVFVIQYCLQNKGKGKKINFFRDTLANLKKTTYRTLKEVWALSGMPTSQFNKSASEIDLFGNTISFLGVNDDPMRAMGLESDIALMGEATSLIKEHCDQIEQRTKEFFIYDYNPNSAIDHWVYKKEKLPNYRLHKTTIFDNKYAPKNAVKKILSYAHPDNPAYETVLACEHMSYAKESWDALLQRNIELNTADLYLWQVYGLGMRAVGEDIIYDKWKEYTDEDKPDSSFADWSLIGGDFGYSSDPSAAVFVEKFGNNIYLKEILYETGLLNADIAKFVINCGYNEYISIWDSADGLKSVNELRSEGLNASGAKKGVGSVSWGIQYAKKFNLFIHNESLNLKKEIKDYKWKKARSGEYVRNTLKQRVPSDNQSDHLLDAMRYAITYYAEGLENEDNR